MLKQIHALLGENDSAVLLVTRTGPNLRVVTNWQFLDKTNPPSVLFEGSPVELSEADLTPVLTAQRDLKAAIQEGADATKLAAEEARKTSKARSQKPEVRSQKTPAPAKTGEKATPAAAPAAAHTTPEAPPIRVPKAGEENPEDLKGLLD